jgi:hypothetical protein
MDCRNLEDQYAPFLLGALSDTEQVLIQEHLENGCTRCMSGIRESSLAVCALLRTVRPVRSEPGQKARFLRRLKEK